MNRVNVKLLEASPLWLIDEAIGKCWNKPAKSVEHSIERMNRVVNKNQHKSTSEHVSYTWDVDGISRACLQEISRHRHQSLSVRSSRYTLGSLAKEPVFEGKHYSKASKHIYMTGDVRVDNRSIAALNALQEAIKMGISNDITKYCMPECMRTSLVLTMNMRSLQHFLDLRTNKAALKEIRNLAHMLFNTIPEDHKFMFTDYVHPEVSDVS